MALTDKQARSDHLILAGALLALKGGYYQATLAGDVALDDTYPAIVGLDPGGAGRTVTLDGAAATDGGAHGLFRVIVNRADAAEDLTVEDADAGAVGTVSQDEAGLFYHDEDDGWVLVCLVTIALS